MTRGVRSLFFLTLILIVKGDKYENEVVAAINSIDSEESFALFGGLSIQRLSSARSLEPTADNVLQRVEQYLQTHELEWDMPSVNTKENFARSQSGEAPRTRRLRKILLPLLLLLKLKMGVIVKLAIVVIKFMSLKALALSIVAVLFAGSSLLKDLIIKKKDHVTTAYISGAPLNTEIIHSDWNRNGQASAHDLAYNYHTVPQGAF